MTAEKKCDRCGDLLYAPDWSPNDWRDQAGYRHPGPKCDEVQAIQEAVAQAVAAEREACAKVAESTRFRVALIGKDCDVYKHRDGDYVTPVIAAAIRARGSLGPVIQHTEKTAEAADIPMEWLRCPASKPDDVDYPADHFGDMEPPKATARHDGDDRYDAKCPSCSKSVLYATHGPLIARYGFLFWRCPHCGVMMKEDMDQRLRVSPEPADRRSNWTTGPIVDLGGEG